MNPRLTGSVAVRTEHLCHVMGLWCNRCLLSTGVRCLVVITAGPSMSLLTRDQCSECGSHDVSVPEGV